MPSTDHPDAIPTLTVDQRRALTLLGVRITHPGTFAVTTRHRFHGTATTDAVAAMRLADSLRVLADGIDHAIDRQDEESEASDADRIHAAAVKIAALAEKAAAMNQNRMAQIKEAAAAIAAYADDIRPECPE